jgi:hypothetical protein
VRQERVAYVGDPVDHDGPGYKPTPAPSARGSVATA